MNKRLQKKMKLKESRFNRQELRRKVGKQLKEIEALEAALKKAHVAYKEKDKENENVRAANRSLFKQVERVQDENRTLEIEGEEVLEKLKAQKYYILELEQKNERLEKQIYEQKEELLKFYTIPKIIKKLCVR